MSKMRFAHNLVIDATPEEAYAIVADYQDGHPHIVPKKHFSNWFVEAGGKGAGTIVRFRMRVLGVTQEHRAQVYEPEPGRVLMETEDLHSIVTKFIFTPLQEGRQVRVEIVTEMDASPGITGVLERMLMPRLIRDIYITELHQLAEIARQRSTTASRSF